MEDVPRQMLICDILNNISDNIYILLQVNKLIKCVDLYSDSSVKDVPVRNKYSMVIAILSREITIKLSTHGLSLLSNRVYLPSSHMRCVIFLKFFSMEIRWSLQWSQTDESLPRDVIQFYGNQLPQKVHSGRWQNLDFSED